MSRRALMACVAASCLAAQTLPSEACTINWNFNFGQDGTGIVRAKPGETCGAGTSPGANQRLVSLGIVERAMHGIAGFSGFKLAYQAAPDYVGTDRFVAEYRMERSGTTVSSRVTFNVIIQR